MLEWLKTILGDTYTEDIEKKISAEIGKGFIARSDYNAVNEAKKTLEGQVSERDKQIEGLKKVDPEKLQAEITRLQGENAAAQKKFDDDLKAARLNFALEAKLSKEGAVNTKAVRALLDCTKISLDGENLVGIDDQLKSLKEKEKWAFAPTDPNVPGAGGNPPPASGDQKAPLPSGTVIF